MLRIQSLSPFRIQKFRPWENMSSRFEKICAFCEESFPIEEIKDHIAINHLGAEPQPIEASIQQEIEEELQSNLNRNECTLCDIGFPSKSTLKDHLKNFHDIKQTVPKRPKPKCDICGKEFARSSLSRHKRIVHEGIKISCDLCEESFTCASGLRSHFKRRHGTLQFPCEQCEKSYSTQAGLVEHKRKDHDKTPIELSCDICEKDFESRQRLGQHIRRVHKKEEQSCELCDKAFTCSEGLRAHVRTVHEGKKIINELLRCDRCGKLVSKYYLPKHSCKISKMERKLFIKMCARSKQSGFG